MTYELDEFFAAIKGIEGTQDPRRIRVKSRDRYAISPLLRDSLDGKFADAVVNPKSLEEIRRVVSSAARLRIPVTLRGGGTANYGQSVPLKGGIVLDMTQYSGVVSVNESTIRARGGTLVSAMDEAAKAIGRELRMHPTTARQATIAGYLAGGTGGPGSVVYGILRDRGNITGVQVMTMEEEPRILELKGSDAQLIHHTYGATGIILEVEMPLAPAYDWIEALVAFPDYHDAVKFGFQLAKEAAIIRKVVSVQEWPTPQLIRNYAQLVPEGHSICSTMIAPVSWDDFTDMVEAFGGTLVGQAPEGKGPWGLPIWEFVFGHALFQIQKTDPRRTGLEGFFRDPDLPALVRRVHDKVKHYGPMRMEIVRIGGDIVGSGSPYFIYESPEQMAGLVKLMQEAGAGVSNSHTTNVRAVGKKEITDRDVSFKREVDPYGLLNPGRFEADDKDDAKAPVDLPTDKWDRRLG